MSEKWFVVYRELALLLSSFYEANQNDPGRNFADLCARDSVFVSTNKWFKRATEGPGNYNVDPIQIFVSINDPGTGQSLRIKRIILLFRILGSPRNFDDIDFSGCPTLFTIKVMARRPLEVQKAIWELMFNITTLGRQGLNQKVFEDVNGWYGINIASLTVFLFWIDAENFISMDQNTVNFLRFKGFIKRRPKNFEEYSQILNDAGIRDYPQLSIAAKQNQALEITSKAVPSNIKEIRAEKIDEILKEDKRQQIAGCRILSVRIYKKTDIKWRKVLTDGKIYNFYCAFRFAERLKTFRESNDNKIGYQAFKDIPFYQEGRLKVHISAIVGENGSGKSTLTELLFIIINNFTVKYSSIPNDLIAVENIYADLFFITDALYKLSIQGDIYLLKKYSRTEEGFEYSEEVTLLDFDFEQFFYSIVTNYALYALNSISLGEWVTKLFHKNDQYQAPIVINPFRKQGNINVNSENDLIKSRMVANLLLPVDKSKRKNDTIRKLTSSKLAETFLIKLDKNKFQYLYKIDDKFYPFSLVEVYWFKVLSAIKTAFKITQPLPETLPTEPRDYIDAGWMYLIKKIISICITYRDFKTYYTIETNFFEVDRMEDLIEELQRQTSHVTHKFYQTIHFFNYQHLAAVKDSNNTALEIRYDNDGTYLVKATFIGYKDFLSNKAVISGQQVVGLPAIVMVPAGKTLNAVSVTAKKSFVEQKIDRTVVNVGALISNTGTNALEVLQKTPGVQVDADGNITFKGKSGVMVMIDDKPTYLSATNLVTYLKSLPASSLDQIELMDNPPAKYDAAGNAGVINIKTKKNSIRGFHAVLGGDYAQGFYGRNSENANLNYRVDKVNLFANLGYDENRTWRRLEIDRDYLDDNGNTTSSLKDISYFRPTGYNTNIKAGMDFYASPKTTWGIVYTGTIERDHDNSPVYSLIYGQNAALDSSITTLNTSHNQFNSNGLNLNYTHKFDSLGRELTFDLDFIRDVSNSNQQFVNNTYLPDNTLTYTTMLTDNLPAYIDIYSAKADYAHPLPGKAKFEAGIKSSYVNTDNAANYFNVVNGVSSIDYSETNRFLYKENINAAYANFNKNWGRFAIQTGLRVENTNGNGHQLGNAERADSSFINHYTNLFPTAYVSYNLDTAAHNVLVASYGRRIGRPNYGSLNPFTFFVDEFTQFSGNPFLRPQFTDNYKLAYSYRSLFTVALTYNYTTDVQGETIHRDSDVFISTQGNIGQLKTLDFSVTSNFSPTKWWTVNLYAEVYKNTYQGAFYTGYLNQSKVTISGNGNNQFTISPTWSAELSGFFDTGGAYGQFVTLPKGMLNGAIQKKILNNKGSLKLTVQNMLQSFSPSGTITNIVDARATFHNTLDTRVATLAFTYSFGQSNNIPQKRETGGADSEQGRAH